MNIIHLKLNEQPHDWRKTNLFTLKDGVDKYVCKKCGAKGKRPAFADYMIIDGRHKADKTYHCDKTYLNAKRIKVTKDPNLVCFNPTFSTIRVGLEFDVIDAPKTESLGTVAGVWVNGANNEPCKLMLSEYEVIEWKD